MKKNTMAVQFGSFMDIKTSCQDLFFSLRSKLIPSLKSKTLSRIKLYYKKYILL